jgi:uncharacterized repeat protein (TIGR03843 family)
MRRRSTGQSWWHTEHDEATLRMMLFDALANNADRKGGHLLRTENALYGIDHGVTFHVEPKLRTVLWGLAGAAYPDEALLRQVADALDGLEALEEWLTDAGGRADTGGPTGCSSAADLSDSER